MRRALPLAAVLLFTSGAPATSGDGGLIVFSSNRSQWRANHVFLYAPGGQLRALAEGSAAVFSPDRTRIAFVRGGLDSGRELVVMGANGSGQRTLVRQPEGAKPISARHGLAWSSDGTRVAFLELGPTIGVADVETGAVRHIDNALVPSWSPDGRRLVYEDTSAVQPGLIVANTAGTEARRLVTVSEGTDLAPQWSPSGRWIVYRNLSDLRLIAPDGTGGRHLTRDGAFEQLPSWSPDGRRIAFFRTSADGRRSTVRVVDVGGRTLADVVAPAPTGHGSRPAWTRDGKRLLLVTSGALRVVRVADGRVTRIVPPPAAKGVTGPADWARDGRLLLSGHMTLTDRELYTIRPDGAGLRRLTHNAVDDRDPSWSPDGRRIVFVRPGGIHVARADGRGVAQLTSRRGDAGPAWSPDGRRIAFTRDGRVWLMDADGRRERALAGATTLGSSVSWSPDGSRIVLSDRGSVYVVDVAGGRRTQLTRFDLDLAPAWSPDGSRIVFSAYRDERYFRDPEAWGLFEVAADGSGFHKLLTGYYHNVAWSPDATQLVFQSYGVLWRANADGTGLVRVIGDNSAPAEGWNERPSWGP